MGHRRLGRPRARRPPGHRARPAASTVRPTPLRRRPGPRPRSCRRVGRAAAPSSTRYGRRKAEPETPPAKKGGRLRLSLCICSAPSASTPCNWAGSSSRCRRPSTGGTCRRACSQPVFGAFCGMAGDEVGHTLPVSAAGPAVSRAERTSCQSARTPSRCHRRRAGPAGRYTAPRSQGRVRRRSSQRPHPRSPASHPPRPHGNQGLADEPGTKQRCPWACRRPRMLCCCCATPPQDRGLSPRCCVRDGSLTGTEDRAARSSRRRVWNGCSRARVW